MSRGSSTGPNSGESSSGATNAIEMLGAGGSFDVSGKKQLVKKYFVTTEGDLENAPDIPGYTATNISHTKVAAGWEQSVQYESIHSGKILGQTGFQGTSSDRGTFEIISSYEIKPIIRHPRIRKLMETYQGTEPIPGYVVFPQLLSTRGPLGGSSGQLNPMYGITSYKEYTFTLRHTYYKENPSAEIFSKAGSITEKLPGNFPIPKGETDSEGKEKKRRWLVQVPNMRKEGRGWRIEQDYVLLDAAGFADEMYLSG